MRIKSSTLSNKVALGLDNEFDTVTAAVVYWPVLKGIGKPGSLVK